MDPLRFEHQVNSSIPDKGYVDVLSPSAGQWFTAAGGVLTTSSAPQVQAFGASAAAGVYGIQWEFDDDETDPAILPFTMPDTYAELANYLRLVVPARKRDTAADENANLALEAQIRWIEPGTVDNPSETDIAGDVPTIVDATSALQELTTPVRALLAAAVIAADETTLTGFGRYVLDLGAQLAAEETSIPAGSACLLLLRPHEQVGATNMSLEILPPQLWYRRHGSLKTRSDRW